MANHRDKRVDVPLAGAFARGMLPIMDSDARRVPGPGLQ